MHFIAYLLCWYAIAFGLYALHVAWSRRRAERRACLHESTIALREGETILGVGDTLQGVIFHIGTSVRDEKRDE